MATTVADPSPAAPGDVLAGRFRLLERLGQGGFGEVFRAAELLPDGSTVREVALKLLSTARSEDDWAHEARALAQLSHPALPTIFSAGVLPTAPPRPFVAMELLVGETLDVALAERGPIGWRRALHHARELAGALDATHAAGIVHLDVKPSNVLRERGGGVRLLDFGIAELPDASPPRGARAASALSTAEVLDDGSDDPGAARSARVAVGTPGFMAPEVIEGRPARAAADAYALGVCLALMIGGALPHRAGAVPARGAPEDSVATWRASVQRATLAGDLDLEPLARAAPRGVVALVRALTSLDPAARPAGLRARFDEAWERPFGVPESPYLGLCAYGATAEGVLPGRDDDAARLAAELAAGSVIVLQGASGSGKSSLAVAGVVPALAKRFADDLDGWEAVVVRPGDDVDASLRRARGGASARVGIVLVVDQLEELVTSLDAPSAARFALALSRHSSPTPGLRVLATLREDFTTRVGEIGELARWLEAAVRFVAPPSLAAVREIVVGPARLAGAEIDDAREIVEEAARELRSGEGRLPAVAFALSEWWATRRDGRLSASAWRAQGGVTGALARHADATLGRLTDDQRAAARRLLLCLAGPDATRVRLGGREVAELGADARAALDAFVAARLIGRDDDGAASYVHESLLSAWPTLTGWMEEERVDRAHGAELERAARAFAGAAARERADHLLRGVRLARAEDLARRRGDLVSVAAPLLVASRRRARAETWARTSLALTALLVAAGVVGAGAWVNKQHEREIALRESNLKSLLKEADGVKRTAEQILARYGERDHDAQQLEASLRACQQARVRAEQDHRAAQAARYPSDTREAKLVMFLQSWEHAYNLHSDGKLLSFFAPTVDWMGQQRAREAIVEALAAEWRRSPSNRVMLGDIAVTKREGGEARVRATREERTAGVTTIASVVFVIQGEKPEDLRIVSGEVERTITTGKIVGCRE
ncbi:MAG: serine/threonine protein kinase [Polyangiaceae bacterium]|nr:serine/threonine protein kinase [Polyangiaceae bacterium]